MKKMNQTLAFYVTVLYKDFSSYTGQKLKELGLNYGQLPFIIYIGKRPGCTPSEVTKQLHMDWGHSQRSITKLTEDGFIRKERSKPDSRVCHLFLTESGQRAFETGHEVFFSWDQQNLKDFDAKQVQQILEVLQQLTEKSRKKWQNEAV